MLIGIFAEVRDREVQRLYAAPVTDAEAQRRLEQLVSSTLKGILASNNKDMEQKLVALATSYASSW